MAESIRDKVAVVGMGCTKFGERWDASLEDLLVEAGYEAFEDAQLAANLPGIHGLVLECERSVPGNDKASSNLRQITCQVFSYAIGKVVLARIANQVPKGQHDD